MSWLPSLRPPWLKGNQDTTQPDRRSQNTYEDRSVESRRHFPHPADYEARQTATPSDLQLPSHDNHQRQTKLHATHRTAAPFRQDPSRCDATTASARYSRPCPKVPYTTHSVGIAHPPVGPTHSVGEPSLHHHQSHPGPTTAYATYSGAAVHPDANRPPIPYTVRYNSSSETVLLPSVRQPQNITGHTGSNSMLVDKLQLHGSRDSTTSQAAATTAAAEREPTTTTVTAAAAGGKGPPGILPDGPSADSEEDRIAKSAFYRNSSITRRTLPEGWKPEPLVMEKLPLLPFDGDVRKYHQFRDDFLSLMAFEDHISPRQKLQHLLEVLEGPPRSDAEGYGICDEAYWDVLDMLEAHYGDNTIIRSILLKDFANIPPPTDDRADLTRFLQEAATVKKRLKRTGFDVDSKEMYRDVMTGHLPVPLRLKLIQSYGCRGAKKASCVLDGLQRYLNDIKEAENNAISLRKPCEPAQVPPDAEHLQPRLGDPGMPHPLWERKQDPSHEDKGSVTPSVETAASAVNTPSDSGLTERRTCPLCSLLHQAANCFMYPTIQKRLRRVLKLKICLLCLREGHLAEKCPRRTKSSCKTCGHGQHHRILCKDADDNSRFKTLRSSQMHATTGTILYPASSDRKRSSRKKSVVRGATSSVAAAPVRHSGTQRSSSTRKSIPRTNRKKKAWNHGADSQGRAGTARPTTSSTDERMKHKTAKAHGNGRLLPARSGQLQTEPFSTNRESAADQHGPREAEEDSSPESSDSTPLPPTPGHPAMDG